jgi:Methyltransferase domain
VGTTQWQFVRRTGFNKTMSLWHRVIHPITQHFRRQRGEFILRQFPDITRLRICDLGGSQHFWDKLGLAVPREQITIYNISHTETQGLHDEARSSSAQHIRVLIYDGQHIPEADASYDLLVCNSVLEHVPPAQRAALAAEMRRVAKAVFCQTPAQSFPVEPHFLMPFVHWLPRALGFQLIKLSPWRLLSRPDAATIQEYWWGTRLLGRKELQALFPGARIAAERVLGLTKSYYVIASGQAARPTSR